MTTNFDFVPTEWGDARADAVRAESYGRTDPRSCVFYARRVVEQVVITIYDLESLATPYRSDLAARIGDAGFRAAVGPDVAGRADAIRRVGNIAVHESRAISDPTALNVLRQLHGLLTWAAFTYSVRPDAAPTGTAYDPSLIPAPSQHGSQPSLSATELNQLLATFEAKDAALEVEKATNATLQAELEEARARVIAAQRTKQHPALDHDGDEASTRTLFIDTYLLEAGWGLTEGRDREFRVTGMPNTEGTGFVDYILWGDDGLPLAVIEAKRASRDAAVAQQQAKLYADCLEKMTGRRPVIFWSNGYEHFLWDDAAGYPPRKVAGFFTRDELELMVQRRRSRLPLKDIIIDRSIVERYYQTRAIRAVGDTFGAKQRDALLVMATGSGKTRTVVALVDQLMKAGWAKRVLFLADRVALVNQAVGAFKAHLPNVSTVNLVTEKEESGSRVFVSTYPTMMGLINTMEDGRRRFGPGAFDLIVIDEAHRSVYAKYRAIFDWFDGMLVGLTATPKDEIDRNTYTLFNLENGVPTDAYSLDEAVAEGYLVPPVAVSVPLRFLRQGIHYDQLSESEKDEWDSLDWGEDEPAPTDVNPEELNRWLFNADTVDKALQTLMQSGHKVAGGDVLGKTIIFAKNNAHAEFIRERFDLAYPEHAGHFARVVTSKTEYAQSLIDNFSSPQKHLQIAISVDMLDTGIDVPDVVNLVFFKLVRSVSKFWQMIGRGTRLRPDLFGPGQDKKNFFVFDFCMNLEYFSQPGAGSEGSLQKSLSQRLFEARLGLLIGLDDGNGAVVDDGDVDPSDGTTSVFGLGQDTAIHLREVVAGMNADNFIVRPHREWVDRYAQAGPWQELTPPLAGEIAEHLAGLPSAVRDDDEDAKRFDVTLPMLELARRRIRGLVRFIERAKRAIVFTNFEDEIGQGSIVALPGVTSGTNRDRFRAKARAYLRDHEDHVALQRLRRNKQLTQSDLSALEEMLVASGAGGVEDIARARDESQGLGLFVRSLVGLDRQAATEAFSDFLTDTRFSVAEIRFVQLIVEQLTANGLMEAARLYESPFTDHAPTGPDFLFADADVERIIATLSEVRATAVVQAVVA